MSTQGRSIRIGQLEIYAEERGPSRVRAIHLEPMVDEAGRDRAKGLQNAASSPTTDRQSLLTARLPNMYGWRRCVQRKLGRTGLQQAHRSVAQSFGRP
jgi:hypothetical protein